MLKRRSFIQTLSYAFGIFPPEQHKSLQIELYRGDTVMWCGGVESDTHFNATRLIESTYIRMYNDSVNINLCILKDKDGKVLEEYRCAIHLEKDKLYKVWITPRMRLVEAIECP